MKTIQCDVCKRTTPNVDIKFARRAFGWLMWNFAVKFFQETYKKDLDVCTDCWEGFEKFMQSIVNKKYKEPSPPVRLKQG